ncbi:DUF1351 domain-containing protein [Lactobacillus intestinalis]|uniref:DUF1351 domain-containing protein n=1 Tax=Lactobacillus intestinalis TaxID=151781 RepID=UPI0026F04EA8|nr:DUF1351 domain-containing protein [Lactobacillus intestinalis]
MENNIIDPKTLKVQSELPRIEFENQNQLEKTVDAMVERFTGLVVTKDTYKRSKEVRAQINKVIKIIDRQRIDKVNEVKKPIDDFNNRTKNLTAKLSTVSDDLGKQLNEYNDKRRAGKHEIQFAKFKQIVDEYGLQLDQVTYNPKWDNLSLAFPTFVKETNEVCEKVLQAQKQLKEIRQAVIARGDELSIGVQPFLEQVGKKDLADILRDMSNYKKELINIVAEKEERKQEFDKNNQVLANGMDAPQISGSAASYAKKGALANLFLIDDGSSDPDSTSGKPVKPTQPRTKQAKSAKPLPKPKPKFKKYTPAEMLKAQVTYGGKKTNIWNVYTKAFKEKDVTAQTWWKENHNNPDSALGNLIRQYGSFMKEKEAEKAKEAQQSK